MGFPPRKGERRCDLFGENPLILLRLDSWLQLDFVQAEHLWHGKSSPLPTNHLCQMLLVATRSVQEGSKGGNIRSRSARQSSSHARTRFHLRLIRRPQMGRSLRITDVRQLIRFRVQVPPERGPGRPFHTALPSELHPAALSLRMPERRRQFRDRDVDAQSRAGASTPSVRGFRSSLLIWSSSRVAAKMTTTACAFGSTTMLWPPDPCAAYPSCCGLPTVHHSRPYSGLTSDGLVAWRIHSAGTICLPCHTPSCR